MKATWIQEDGNTTTLEVKQGTTLMHAATDHGIAYVIGECGGSMSCATCHVVLDAAWVDRAGLPSGFEDEMLDTTEADRRPNSRLSCQITMRAELDGIVLHVPKP